MSIDWSNIQFGQRAADFCEVYSEEIASKYDAGEKRYGFENPPSLRRGGNCQVVNIQIGLCVVDFCEVCSEENESKYDAGEKRYRSEIAASL